MRPVHDSNIKQSKTSGPFLEGTKEQSELSKSVSNARQLVSSQEALLRNLQELRKELTSLDWEASSLRYDVGIHHCSRLPEPTLQVPLPARLGSKPPIGPSRETGRSVTRRNSFSSMTRSTSRSRSVSRNSSASELFSDNSSVHGLGADNPGDHSPKAVSPLNRGSTEPQTTRRSRSRRRVTLSGGIQPDAVKLDQNCEPQEMQMTSDHMSHPVELTSSSRSHRWSYVESSQ